jgi:hypothetical protein
MALLTPGAVLAALAIVQCLLLVASCSNELGIHPSVQSPSGSNASITSRALHGHWTHALAKGSRHGMLYVMPAEVGGLADQPSQAWMGLPTAWDPAAVLPPRHSTRRHADTPATTGYSVLHLLPQDTFVAVLQMLSGQDLPPQLHTEPAQWRSVMVTAYHRAALVTSVADRPGLLDRLAPEYRKCFISSSSPIPLRHKSRKQQQRRAKHGYTAVKRLDYSQLLSYIAQQCLSSLSYIHGITCAVGVQSWLVLLGTSATMAGLLLTGEAQDAEWQHSHRGFELALPVCMRLSVCHNACAILRFAQLLPPD